MRVSEVMTSPVHVIGPDAPAWEAIALMRSHHIRRLPVVEDGRLVGIVTWTDVVRVRPPMLGGQWAIPHLEAAVHVRHLMTPSPHTIGPEFPVDEAAALMRRLKVGGLPVIDGDRVVGIVTESDLFEAFARILSLAPGEVRLRVPVPSAAAGIPRVVAELSRAGVPILALHTLRTPKDHAIYVIIHERDKARTLDALRVLTGGLDSEQPLEHSMER